MDIKLLSALRETLRWRLMRILNESGQRELEQSGPDSIAASFMASASQFKLAFDRLHSYKDAVLAMKLSLVEEMLAAVEEEESKDV